MPVATQRGGAEATLVHLLRHGREDSRWLIAFLEAGPMVELAASLGAESVVIPAGRVRDLPRLVAVVHRLVGAMRAWRPDVVLSWMSKAHLYTAPAAGLLGIPALWFQHGLPSRTDPIDRLAALAPAATVLVPSRTVATAQAAIWPRRRTHVIYPGVDVEWKRPQSANAIEMRASANLPAKATVVGMVGRLQRWKGMHVLVEAMPAVLARCPDAHAVIVGGDHPLEPGYRDGLLAIAARLGVQDRIHLVGYHADARCWMDAFDVVVHASDTEPFGLVVLEAMALGKPLIAGARGGPSEVVREGVDGFLVEFEDVGALADRIVRYLEEPDLARRMGSAAAERAREFSDQRFAREVVRELRCHVRNVA
jgi:glycosyltransferase involved in cell wall biosynthesis